MFSCALIHYLVFEVGIKLYSSVGFALQVSNEQRVMLTDRKAEDRKKGGGEVDMKDRKVAAKE